MTFLRALAGLAAVLATAATAAPVDGHFAAKSLAARGDRFIQLGGTGESRFVNIAADRSIAYKAGAVEMRMRGAGAAPLRYEFEGAASALPTGEGVSGITYNFLVGPRERWQVGLKSFARVAYRGAWSGIDATYVGDAAGVKYHFDVAAGAEPRRIGFIVRGATSARIAADGSVEWTLSDGSTLRDEPPVSWQSDTRGDKVVATAFTLAAVKDGWRLGFNVGEYDRSRPLVIDPAWTAFSGLVGGNASDQVYGVARDASGNTFACGVTASGDLPTTAGAQDLTHNGDFDAFVVKFNATGIPQFVTYLGGGASDKCTSIGVHPGDGALYLAGGTASIDFPLVGTADANFRKLKTINDSDAFVARLAAAGNAITWSGVIGGASAGGLGTHDEEATAIAVDSTGAVYVTGYTTSPTGFPIVTGPGTTRSGATDAFVAKIDAPGVGLAYSGLIGGDGGIDAGWGVAVAPDGTAYVVGETDSTSAYPSTAGTFRTTPGAALPDGFVARISPAGVQQQFTFLTGQIGIGTGVDRARAVAVASDGSVIVGGETHSSTFPMDTGGAQAGAAGLQGSASGSMDGFVVRLAANLSSVLSRTYLGGSGFDVVEAVAADAAAPDSYYVAGTTAASGFPTIATTGLNTSPLGGQDGFVGRLGSGSTFLGLVGSNTADAVHALAATPDKVLAVGGAVTTNTLAGANTAALSGGASATNGVVVRMNQFGVATTLSVVSGTPQSGDVNAPFGAPLVVRVIDAESVGVSGVEVTFTAPGAGASAVLGPATPVLTDGDGNAQVTASANSLSGAYVVTAAASGLGSVNFALTNLPNTLVAVSGTPQNGNVNGAFSASLVVRVINGDGVGVAGVNVTFAAPVSGASAALLPTSPIATDATGYAQVTAIANGVAGTYDVSASVPGLGSVNFALTNRANTLTAFSGSPQQGTVNTAFAAPLVVRLANADGVGVAGVNVTFAAPVSGASAALAPASPVVTDVDGKAQVTATANGTLGAYDVTADAGGLPTVSFALTNGAMTLAVVSGAPQTANLSAAFGAPLVVRVTDAGGNGLPGVNVTFAAPGAGASAALAPASPVVTNGTGHAQVTATANNLPGTYSVTATLGSASVTFSLTNRAEAATALRRGRFDFNADTRGDVVLKHSSGAYGIWLMNGLAITGSTAISGGAGALAKRFGDYDGDGRSDIVWRLADGTWRMDLMNGLAVASSGTLLAGGSGWEVVAHGDFNGDNKADLVWRRSSDGYHGMWLMNATTALPGSAGATPLPGPGFEIALVGDFNGDGKSDLLWTHADGRAVVALMDGLSVASSAQVLPAATGWLPSHVGDFNGDGKDDLVWKKADGTYGLWLMNGTTAAPSSLLGPGTGWSVKLVTDLDGNGKDDLVWDKADGTVGGWLMDGATIGPVATMMPAGAGWSVVATQDFDADSKGDLVWRKSDGTYAIWLMNGLALSTSAYVLGGGTGWEVVSP